MNDNNSYIKKIHKEFYQGKKINWTDRWASTFKKFIYSHDNKDSILDVGCGNGSFIRECKEKGFNDCHATDIITVELGITDIHPDITYHSSPISELEIPGKKFNIVTSYDCLEHLHEDEVDASLDKIFSLASDFICLTITHTKSGEKLKDGTNLHQTVKSWNWWEEKLEQRGTLFLKYNTNSPHRSNSIWSPKPILYCDIDSTINKHWKRIQRFSVNGKCNWDKAFSEVEIMKDEVLEGSHEALKKLSKVYNIVFLTARPFPDAERITKAWLSVNNFVYSRLVVVKTSKAKIPYVIKKGSLFIDDLARKHESHPPYTILYDDVIKELDQKGVNYIRFKGDWQEVLEQLGL
jgi:5'(3')-deoxyribonucleotidase